MTMTRKENVGRHGSTDSTGAESWRSQDTVRSNSVSSRRRGAPMKIRTDKQPQDDDGDKDNEISPGTTSPESQPSRPWERPERRRAADFSNYRKDLAVLELAGNNLPSISRVPPTASASTPPWATSNGSSSMASSIFPGSFYNDSNEDIPQLSPGFRPGSGRTDDVAFPGEDRRPSVASATTVSSSNSRSSIGRGFHKKLQGFFGDEYNGSESRQGSEASLATNAGEASRQHRNRNNSLHNTTASSTGSRPGSPASSRPRTPLPSSDITPWEYQESKETPSGQDRDRLPSDQQSIRSTKTTHSHKLPFHGHRHHRSNDESKPTEQSHGAPLRPVASRDESSTGYRGRQNDFSVRAGLAMTSKAALGARSASPTGSTKSGKESIQQKSPGSAMAGKRSLFDKLRRKDKADGRGGLEGLRDLPQSTVSLQQSIKSGKSSKTDPVKGDLKNKVLVQGTPGSLGQPYVSYEKDKSSKKEGGSSRIPFKSKRGYAADQTPPSKDPNDVQADTTGNEALWNLDTDLSHMEGIINPHQGPMTPPTGEPFAAWPDHDTSRNERKETEPTTTGVWDAPDSWAVKRVGDDATAKLPELDEHGKLPKFADQGPPYCVRIFRVDSTFAVLSVGLYATVAEIILILGKKSFLQDELGNYHIVMRKHDTSRQLEPAERPLLIQKALLEQAGYTEADRIEDVGREDNSYLCRFTFLPAKMSGYSSLEKDPGFSKMQKFSHIDLQGRNLITIPITLYQKATEIISLNLSRNLSLDIPKDFIQACTNLREIKYTSNEASRLPPSLSLAQRLTMLDVSNNRLESLDHAELWKLQGLLSLRLSNNKITSLPSYFGMYRALRSLNLSSNSLQEFPDFLCDVTTLVDLDISFNSISSLPKIGQLTSLERLWATNNKLAGSFPDDLRNLTNLKEIDVRFNAIDNIDIMSQLPNLEYLMIGHNSISAFEGSFYKIRVLHLNHNPVTRFGLNSPVPTLSVLNLASAKLAQLPEDLFRKVSGLTKFILDKNHFVSLSAEIGKLVKLEHLSLARNNIDRLPPDVGRLTELRYLDVRENNLNALPQEIWYARRLETLNVSSNVLDIFPKPGPAVPTFPTDPLQPPDSTPATTPGLSATPGGLHPNPSLEDLGTLEDVARRPSGNSGLLTVGGSPGGTQRNGSVASTYASSGRKASTASRTTEGTLTPVTRKDSSLSNRMVTTFAGSLRHLFLADNRLTDDVFDELALLPELRIVNLSYNLIYDIPLRSIRRWQHLTELYLSGNDLTSLPAEDLEEVTSLRVLHLNGNKFQVLPAELGKVAKLAVLDVGSNSLKYNVSNWPYDWNWNWNHNLRYLNLSGNKRLEIKPNGSFAGLAHGREGKDLTDFTSLTNLRVLGLMDVTLMVPSVPDQSEDKRVRTAGSTVGTMSYGMADSLGRNEHLSTMDMVVPRFRSHDDETLFGMFDGQALPSGGSKIAKYLYDNFKVRFADELDRIRPGETAVDALRRSYLGLNKDLAGAATACKDKGGAAAVIHRTNALPDLSEEDLNSGSVATVVFLKEMELYVSNVGDAQALLIHSEGSHRIITRKHDPAEPGERTRIREAGGFVSRQGRLNDVLEVSRAFGYIQMSPSVIAAPHVSQISLRESDEMILVASRELWDYLTPDFAVDVARSERGDLMRAAQKLRDLAIAFGATGKIMVMLIGVSDLRKRERARFRTHSMSMGPIGPPDEWLLQRQRKRPRGGDVADSKLARLDQEVEAPTGEVSLVFTDIKNSTLLWETYSTAMRSAIKMHNEVMRRQLRIIGGYEVKTEGDAFMVAFPTVTSALLWCFTIQSQLLDVQWPQEILNSVNGQEVADSDGNIIFRGLSVRMGIHWGTPVCETDPVTKRMDYFGPMVNRAARISAVADGGQITVSSDFIAEIQRLLETHIETDRSGSAGSEDALGDDMTSHAIRRELRSLSSQGFEVKDLGERRLKGLENPEYIYLMYPHSLASRLVVQQQRAEAEKAQGAAATKMPDSQLTINTEDVWALWNVSLRLEMLCSSMENPGTTELKAPETALLERMKTRGGEITDRFLINFVEHQISRIETCINTLKLRDSVRPFKHGMLSQACPMSEIFAELGAQLAELKQLKAMGDTLDMEPS